LLLELRKERHQNNLRCEEIQVDIISQYTSLLT